MPMIMASLTKLVKGVGEANPDVEFPNIVNRYYRGDIECHEFSWSKRERLRMEESRARYGRKPRVRK